MSVLHDTAPKRIYLCVSDDEDDNDKPYPELYAEDAEITWSTDQPVAVTVEYVRADIAASDLAVAQERVKDHKENSELFSTLLQKTEADLAAARAERDAAFKISKRASK